MLLFQKKHCSVRIGGDSRVNERLQSFLLRFFGDDTYEGLAYDVAVAVNYIGGGVGVYIFDKFSGLTAESKHTF